MSMEHGAGFRITGAVVRRFVPQSRKIAFVTLDVVTHPRSKKIELRTFNKDIINEIAELPSGHTIQVTGSVDVEPVKDKKGNEIKVDGYPKYVAVLTIRELKMEGSSRRPSAPDSNGSGAQEQTPAPASAAETWDDKDVPF